MSKLLKVGGITIGVVMALVLIGWGIFTWFTRQALPKTSGTLKVAGLQAPVEIERDSFGVAHIYGSNPHDLFFAQGYAHAQERFWQMEFQRRTAAGRLSEIFGETTLGVDRYLRQFDFHGLAAQSYEMLDPETKLITDAYAEGVNAYIEDRSPAKLGLEFAFLGLQGVELRIEPWSPVDSLSWSEMMVFDQSDKMETELANIAQLAAVGQEMYADLHPPYREDRPTIIQNSKSSGSQGSPENRSRYTHGELSYLKDLAQAWAARPAEMVNLAGFGQGSTGGSNSFVVSGQLSETGMPILANDPHMAIAMPALWYQVGMHCVEKSPDCIYNFRGVSLPGVPGILIGHNDRIAWGLTNGSFDAEDVFIERINPQNPDQYEVDGQWVDMELRREEIKLQGQDKPVVITVRSTRNGLVGSDILAEQNNFGFGQQGPELYALSYAWPALEPIRTFQAVQKVNRAQTWEEFVSALEYFDAGKQNWLYADVDGNIGYVLPGKVPIRAKGDGTLPVPGWNNEYRWTGFIPYSNMPKAFNPAEGYISAVNHPQLRAQDYKYFLGLTHDRGQRAFRANQLIEGDSDKISLADMQLIQTDNQSVAALEYLPYLESLEFDDGNVNQARDRLVGWDGQMTTGSSEAVLYAFFWKNLLAEVLHDKLKEDQWPHGDQEQEDAIYILLKNPDNDWWDQLDTPDIKERRDATLKTAFEAAYTEAVEQLGDDVEQWQWGNLHTITFENATLGKSGIGFIENIFNRGPFPTHGSMTVLQKTCWSVLDAFTVKCIPAMRQVIDLGDLSKSEMIHSVGQSGHPKSPHYDDFIELWRNFEYIPTNWLRSQVEAGNFSKLTLQPK